MLRRCGGCDTPYHLSCLRELGGCSTLGCAQVGQGGLPKPRTGGAQERFEPERGRPGVSFVVALTLGWASVPFFLFWPLGALLLVGVAAGLRGTGLARWALGLSPFVVLPLANVVLATCAYWAGTARIHGGDDLDPVIRCPQVLHGGCPSPAEELTTLPHDLTLRAWGALCGAMPGSYTGWYPESHAEALEALARAPARPCGRLFEDGVLEVEGRRVTLTPDALYPLEAGVDGGLPLRARVIEERALLLERGGLVVLWDLERGRRLADFEPDWDE
ncbi:MAG: hypothetical protein AB7N76_08615 [Planctomycetota bacterium]